MSSTLSWLLWVAATIALLNLVAMASLVVAYAWHHGLKPKLEHRRARQNHFERLLAVSCPDLLATVPESSSAGREWE